MQSRYFADIRDSGVHIPKSIIRVVLLRNNKYIKFDSTFFLCLTYTSQKRKVAVRRNERGQSQVELFAKISKQ